MPVCALHFTELGQSYFWQPVLSSSTRSWPCLHASKIKIFEKKKKKLLHAAWLTLSKPTAFNLRYSLSSARRLSPFLHSQAGRKSTHTFSLNTLNLNSLLIRRYVTSLTLLPSPPGSPPIGRTPFHSRLRPSLSTLPPFIFTHSSSLS